MTLLAISDGKLQIGDVVNAVVGHGPYVVTRIESDMYFFTGEDGEEFEAESGYVYLIGKQARASYFQNGNGTIHATISGKPLCGHNFTSDSTQVDQYPTCEDCRKLLA